MLREAKPKHSFSQEDQSGLMKNYSVFEVFLCYDEVTHFKQASLVNQSLAEQIRSLSSANSFTQFIADNVNHNIATLDGRGTFHGMGIIAATVNNRDNVIKEINLKRPEKLL